MTTRRSIAEFDVVDQFFAHVEEHGFNGYTPGRGDVLGDSWAKKIGEEFDRVAADIPRSQAKHTIWLIFQWLYCMLAKMEGRVIASPPAIRAAGIEVSEAEVSKACELLLASAEGGD